MMHSVSLLVAASSLAAAAVCAALAVRHPGYALALLFTVASFSRATLETPAGTMRIEMPAIFAVAIVLLVTGRWRILRQLPPWAVIVAGGFLAFLAALGVSSLLIAPETRQSVRMVGWFAISMFGGVVAFVLASAELGRTDTRFRLSPSGALAIAGGVMAVIGIALATGFLLWGPDFAYGVQDQLQVLPRVYAVAAEANLYASFLAICTFFALDWVTQKPARFPVVLLALILIAMPLGITRGAYIAIVCGAAVYVVGRLALQDRIATVSRLGAASSAFVAIGIVGTFVLLPNLTQRAELARIFPPPPVVAAASPTHGGGSGPAASTSSGKPAPTPSPSPSPTPKPAPTFAPAPDNVAFRLERVPVALRDVPESPIVGYGAESFGQRHPERSAGGGADHIAIMGLAVLYESGVVGVIGIVIGFGGLLLVLLQSARVAMAAGNKLQAYTTVAFGASIVTMLVAYQATNALQFAINWIVIGACAAVAADILRKGQAGSREPRR